MPSDARAPQNPTDESDHRSGEPREARSEEREPIAEQRAATSAQRFTRRERIVLSLISWSTYIAISLIGRTLRYSISWEVPPSPPDAIHEKRVIYSFWHRAVFPASWMWRRLGIAVMVSRSFDGEYIARTIAKLGFTAVRGSSSRGGGAALVGMKRQLDLGYSVAFTIDGPRGPKYVAKPGPVALSRASRQPMAAFYVALDHPWVLNTWDQLMIPKPFSRALVRVSAKIQVPPDTSDETMQAFQGELQSALDRVTAFAESNVHRVGSPQFPVLRSKS